MQQLKQGQTETETITVQAKDGTTHDITITIKVLTTHLPYLNILRLGRYREVTQ
ncbi:probable RTX [Vibrio sp. JCM 19236]|nr:probable RTX [Vibrio sp. JCM 19236]